CDVTYVTQTLLSRAAPIRLVPGCWLISCYLGVFRWCRRANLFGRNHSLPFPHTIKPVCFQLLYGLNLARRPANLQAVDLRCLIQPEVHSQVMLRKVAPAAMNLFRLRDSSSRQL